MYLSTLNHCFEQCSQSSTNSEYTWITFYIHPNVKGLDKIQTFPWEFYKYSSVQTHIWGGMSWTSRQSTRPPVFPHLRCVCVCGSPVTVSLCLCLSSPPLLSSLLLPCWLPRGDRHVHVMSSRVAVMLMYPDGDSFVPVCSPKAWACHIHSTWETGHCLWHTQTHTGTITLTCSCWIFHTTNIHPTAAFLLF